MGELLFDDQVDIQFQGDRVLRVCSTAEDFVEYEVIGLSDNLIIIHDRRRGVLAKLDEAIATNTIHQFVHYFNSRARLRVEAQSENEHVFYLDDPDPFYARFMLWYANGIGDEIPVYDYIFTLIEQASDNRYAFLSIYLRPPVTDSVEVFSSSFAG